MVRRSRFLSWLPWRKRPALVTVIRLNGVIGQVGPLRSGLSGQSIDAVIERAFAPKRLAAVALSINSPGGSPVQSALIQSRIRALADERGIPVLAFAEDVAASGGYWLALAADEIYADANSIVGSIGVISASFGFAQAIERLGIERRLFTSGERKSLLDSFLPARDEDVARLRGIQAEIHDSFKAMVRARRGRRLKAEEAVLFSGEFWTGQKALELGLIDGIGTVRPILRERFGEDVRIRTIQRERSLLQRRFGIEEAPAALLQAIEERLAWGRFGL